MMLRLFLVKILQMSFVGKMDLVRPLYLMH